MPLADKIRPKNLDEVAGQKHLLGEGKVLRRIIESGKIPNMIFCGPAGVGKTTVANIIAEQADMTMHKLNGTQANTDDIRQVIAEIGTLSGAHGILLYLDEIQYLTKKQQQNLLEYIENGDITLIASTTENPYFYVYNAILSRSTVFEFKALEPSDIIPVIERSYRLGAEYFHIDPVFENKDEIFRIISQKCGGDVRKSINAVELSLLAAKNNLIEVETVEQLTQKNAIKYDREGDFHYDLLSAFQKSVRGSDENASLHYLARLLLAGDLPGVCRRIIVIAAEDIGLACPNAIVVTKACVDSALQLGMPEARIPLAEAVVYLCTLPKSNSACVAVDRAIADVEKGGFGDVPLHLKNISVEERPEYKYSHDYENHWVEQQYLPDAIKDRVYYEFGGNKMEQAALEYRKKIRG